MKQRKHTILLFLLSLCLSSGAQTPKAGDYIENMSYDERGNKRERTLQYVPDGENFTCINGKNRFTRALYGSHTQFRLETSDRPVFATYTKSNNKHIAFSVKTVGEQTALDSTSYCKSIYKPGKRDYEIKHTSWENGVLHLSAQAFYDRDGAIWKFESSGLPANAILICSISEIKARKLSRNGDMGADPPDAFERPSNPQQLKTFDIALNKQSVYIVFEDGKLFPVSHKTGKELYDKAERNRLEIASTIRIQTPDPFFNTLGGVLSMAADGIWDGKVWQHGAIGWRMPLTGWRAAYTGDVIGRHDRARTHFDAYAASQVTRVEPTIPHPAQDMQLNMARAEKRWGTPMYSNGYICRNPERNDQMHHYDMNLVYIDELLWHFNWTGDVEYVRKMFPVLKNHLAWEKRNFDPDGDGLYNAYACIWASDALQYYGGGVTYASAYNYRANKMAAAIAGMLGEDPEPYRTEADRILNAINKELWMPDLGWWAEFKDMMGNKLLHPFPGIWTIYHAIDSEIQDPFQAYQATRYIDTKIPHIPVTAKGLDGEYHTISTTGWMPYAWSVNNVAFAEVGHTALAYWQAGRQEKAFNLFKSAILDGMYLGHSPGNIGQISYYDAARGECYRDFGDPVGVYSRAVVQGLFGIIPDAMNGRLMIRPGFPASWDHASLSQADIDFRFSRDGMKDRYTITSRFEKELQLHLQINARKDKIKNVQVNGHKTAWTLKDGINAPLVEITCRSAQEYVILIEWAGSDLNTTFSDPESVPGEFRRSVANPTGITAIKDPQNILRDVHIRDNRITAGIQGAPGHRTLFILLKQGQMTWWEATGIETGQTTQKPNKPDNSMISATTYSMVNMDGILNAPVTDIFKNSYLSPRPPYTTLQIPTQGVGEWCHPLLTHEINDSGMRQKIQNQCFMTPMGIPFRMPTGKNNIAFTTLWDNYPDSLSVPLSGKASRIYLLMAGTTNHMQYGVINGTVTVKYQDGSTEVLHLINPDTWAPIEQDYYTDGDAFRMTDPRPYRVAFKTGIVSRDMEKDMGVKPGEVYGRIIDGGAGIILDIAPDQHKTLQELSFKTIANEVIVGLMGITLARTGSTAQIFADSEIKRFPEAWQSDHGKRLYFGYAQGVECLAMLKMWKYTGDKKYFDYVARWADTIINKDGNIHLYEPESYNIDFINPGKILFDIYAQTGNHKYKIAMDRLVNQMKNHPRTSEGGFWHKQIYPHQMWLDGLYMGAPFLAEYASAFGDTILMNDAVNQFLICARHTRDPKTGLYYHAWDESKSQRWADQKTGQSPNFWGRSMGWWFMALVDVLDYLPAGHPEREKLTGMIGDLAKVLPAYQNADGLWYQVLDQGNRAGNYSEASVSSMFMYAFAKAVNRGYIPLSYRQVAEKAYQGIMNKLIIQNQDGTLSLTRCCAVAGLGGNPYRDGSYEYYINERIRDNDAKATGPFIMGCIELGK